MSKQKTNLRNIVVAITLLTLGGAYFHKANAVDANTFALLQGYLQNTTSYFVAGSEIKLTDNITFTPSNNIVFGLNNKTVDGGGNKSLTISGYQSGPVMSWGSGNTAYQTVKFQNITLGIANNSATVFSVGAYKTLSLENTTMTATGHTNSVINVGGGGIFLSIGRV